MKLKKLIDSLKNNSYLLIIFNLLLLIVVFATVTLAWIPTTVRRTKTITYENQIIISSLDIDVTLGVFDSEVNDYVTNGSYSNGTSTADDSINFRLNPSDKMSYKFEITNTSTTSILTCDITFEDFFATYDADVHTEENVPEGGSPDIFSYLSLHVVSPYQNDIDQLSLGFETTHSGTKNLTFLEDLTLAPGESQEIIWYFELSEDATNQFWGSQVGFKSIFFGI